jgi:copper chaperone CopZ
MTRVRRVPKITGEGCVETVPRALDGVPGVQAVLVTTPSREVRVELDAARLEDGRVRPGLAEAGFPPA